MNDNEAMIFNAPKNFKQGRLILNRYRPIDLTVLLICSAVSLVSIIFYVSVLQGSFVPLIVLMLVPAGLSFVLTMPLGIYHNCYVFLKTMLLFNTKNHTYLWEGIYKDDVQKE